MSKKHKIAPEVKADIIRRVKEEGVSVSEASKEHGVSEASIYTWLGSSLKGAPSWSEFSRLEKKYQESLQVIGELTVSLSTAQKKS